MNRLPLNTFCVGLLVCLGLVVGVSASRSMADTPLANVFEGGDMSTGDPAPAGWSISWQGSGKIEVLRDTSTYESAPSSLCVRSVGGAAQGSAGHQLDASLKSFTVNAYIKSTGSLKQATLVVQSFDKNWKQTGWTVVGQLNQSSDWTHVTQKITIPDGTMASLLGLLIEGNGSAWLDDVVVSPDSPTAPAGPTQEAPALPITISATNNLVRYVGRFAVTDAGPTCSWPASMVSIRFQSNAVNVRINQSSSNDEYEVFVDAVPTAALVLSPGDHLYRIFTDKAPGVHTLDLVKRTETFFGTGTFEQFQLAAGGKPLKIMPRPHKIELVGDSISCGYGDEASSQNEHFSSPTEDASFAYGAIASRALDADFVCIAGSGKLMWPKNTMSELYDRILAGDENSKWDFGKWTPDVVVINLSTNDFAGGVPDETGWTTGYEAFIARVRGLYPKARIYCCMSPMMGGTNENTLGTYLAKIVADEKASGETNVALMPFKTQDTSLGLGADWHPNIANQKKLADTMAEMISTDLGWKLAPDPSAAATLATLQSQPTISLTQNNGNP